MLVGVGPRHFMVRSPRAASYYGTAARHIAGNSRRGSPRFCPAPLKRRPERMNHYSTVILRRMSQMGW